MAAKRGWIVILLTILCLMVSFSPASAQDPEPTPTPTPPTIQAVALSSGHEMHIDRTVTYGEIAVTAAVLLLVIVELLKGMIQVPKDWFK